MSTATPSRRDTSRPAYGSPLKVSSGLQIIQRRAEQYLVRAKGFSSTLHEPPYPPDIVHKLRTHLRRLQAYAEFSDRPAAASRLDHCVKCLSGLRTLHVFRCYLRDHEAGVRDLRRVDKAIREEERSVARKASLKAVRAVLARTSTARIRRPAGFMTAKLKSLGRDHAARLADALRNVSPKPTRKELHRIRLLVKSLRYQVEIVRGTIWADSRRLAPLKQLQKTVGNYCDLYQFRRLAKKMNLNCRGQIKKKYRRSRACALAAVRKLGPPASAA